LAVPASRGATITTVSDDLADVLKETGAEDAALVGFSMGGGEVARYMSRHAAKGVIRAALVSSVVPFMLKTADNPGGAPQSVFDGMAQQMKEDRAAFFSGFFKDFYGVGMFEQSVSQGVLDWSWNIAMSAGLKPTLACAQAFATTDFRPDLAAFNKPTLIIHGTGDKTVPIDASGRAAAAGIRSSQLIEYEGSPHGLFATDKEKFTSDLLTFLRG
jgi:non-heme chloroperoxidase